MAKAVAKAVFEPTRVIEVLLWGERVAAIAPANTRTQTYAIQYFPDWVKNGVALSPLHLRLQIAQYVFPNLNQDTWHGLPPEIADSMPDAFGNAIIDAELARRGASFGQVTPLDRLSYVGSRAMGALEFRPVIGPDAPTPTLLEIGELVGVARDVVTGTLGSSHESREALAQILTVGTSAGGARAKAVINIDETTGEITAGQLPKASATSWLLKFDGVGKDKQLGESEEYGRIEYAYAQMARAAGINMPPTRLLEENGRAHFMARRFDRPGGEQRLHMLTLCGIAHLDFNAIGVNDYAQLQVTIDALKLGMEAKQEAFRRMIFNYVVMNCDDHTKNHAFLMDREGRWSLSPAYDITFAYSPTSRWVNQHLMGVDGKFENLTRKDALEFAQRHGIQAAKAMIRQVNEAVSQWPKFACDAGLRSETISTIGDFHVPIR